MSKKDIIESLISGFFALLFGVIFLIASIFLVRRAINFSQNGIDVQGTVIDQERFLRNGEYRYRTFVEFKPIDGPVTRFTTENLNRRLSDGYQVDVQYLPSDPGTAQVMTAGGNWVLPGIMSLVSVAGIGFGVYGFIRVVNARRLKAELMERGEMISAEITQIIQKPTTTRRRRQRMQPYNILAQWHDPMANKIHIFKSQNIWFNPALHAHIGDDIEVLIDPNNPQKYLVDVSFLPEVAQ